ncbi:MAG: tyrosine-type recombinase/integrase, partial [Chloroflexota bacterium]|nr:tyrosine-type recombinase/integrase [Chloroflexota bacterium]
MSSPVAMLPDVPPRTQVLLHDPVAFYLDGLEAESSREQMRRQLTRIARLVGCPTIEAVPWENLRLPHYAELANRLRVYRRDPEDANSGLAPATLNLALSALRGVATAVWELGYMTAEDHARVLKGLKPARGTRLPAGRSARRGEIGALLDACAKDPSPSGARDAAMIALMYSTGLRRAELAGLRLDSYSPVEGQLRVVGKGNRERALPVIGGAAAALADWLVERGTQPAPLFLRINKGGRVLELGFTDDAVYGMLRKRNRQAGLSEDLTPHDLRRTFMTQLFAAKTPTP